MLTVLRCLLVLPFSRERFPAPRPDVLPASTHLSLVSTASKIIDSRKLSETVQIISGRGHCQCLTSSNSCSETVAPSFASTTLCSSSEILSSFAASRFSNTRFALLQYITCFIRILRTYSLIDLAHLLKTTEICFNERQANDINYVCHCQ